MKPKEDSSELSSTKEASKSKESQAGQSNRAALVRDASKGSTLPKRDDSSELGTKEKSKSKENQPQPHRTASKSLANPKEDLLGCRYMLLYLGAGLLFVYCVSVLFFGNFICREIEFRCVSEHGAFYGAVCEASYLTWGLKCVAYETNEEVLENCRNFHQRSQKVVRLRKKSKICDRWNLENSIIRDLLSLW